jgi:hypothetical protein
MWPVEELASTTDLSTINYLGRFTRMGWFSDSDEKQEKLEHVFDGREPLDVSQLWESYFRRERCETSFLESMRSSPHKA